jgi:hypothetical protein
MPMKLPFLIATILTTAVVTSLAQGAITNAPGPGAIQTNAAALARTGSNTNFTGHSSITPVQLQNINRLDIELGELSILSRDAASQQRALMDTLKAAPIASVRPSAESISKLGATLTTVVPSLGLSPLQRRQLAIDVNLALNSGNLSPSQAERVIADARRLLQLNLARNPQGVEELMGELSTLLSQIQGSLAQQNPQNGQEGAVPAEPGTVPTPTGQSARSQTGQGSESSSGSAVPSR